ncbi:MAG TPA: thioesterase domain-containing protein [Bryobacteraceae bacterium]|nr:thioesterase domain-containing protein [Bryobacteraceae bacterium]
MSRISTVEELIPFESTNAPGRGGLTPVRLAEHLQSTVKRLKKLGIRRGDCVASLLPEGPDAMTFRLALAAFPDAKFAALDPGVEIESQLLTIQPRLLLLHPGEHCARAVAFRLGIAVANVLRHFEAGVFTLESAGEVPPLQASTSRSRGTPLVLIAPGLAYRRLANRLEASNPVIGITPPSLELLLLPHTIEHVAAECVRMLRRYRAHGPYALAGWRTEGLVALEMARLLEEEGDKVVFVALLDASALFQSPRGRIRRAFVSLKGLLRNEPKPSCEFMAEALRQYRPQPWYGKILHIRPYRETSERLARFEWRDIAPHGLAEFKAPAEMLVEPNVHIVAEILASQLDQTPKESAPHL